VAAEHSEAIRVLLVEDVAFEAELSLAHLKRAGLLCTWARAETELELRRALQEFQPHVILSDFGLPRFDGMAALRIARDVAPEVPFIFVSGTIGEERAIDALLCGATDYVLKSNPARLAPAVRRALSDVAERQQRRLHEAQIARLDRVLRMLSGVNALVVRIRDRTELLRETCRLAVSIGGYSTAIVAMKSAEAPDLQPIASSGADESVTEDLCAAVTESATQAGSLIARVLQTGTPFVCNDSVDLEATTNFNDLMSRAGMCSLVALPLVIDGAALGVLLLVAREPGAISDEELRMLREVSGNLSFALQYLQQGSKVHLLSHFDAQTGLANRALFCERVTHLSSDSGAGPSRYAVVVLDIERLSLINDSFGRRIGDLLLQHAAGRLKRRLQQSERVAHFGGGTFALVWDLEAHCGEDVMASAREHTAALFGEPFEIEDHSIPVAVRSGFALFPEHGTSADALVQNAEAALRSARATGARHLHYSPERNSELVARLALEHKLRLALERRQFELHYQPKVDVMTRRIQGVEALIRWRDPEAGLMSPAAFLPLLEATGLIVEVGDWVIQQAAEDCQRWLRAGLPPVRVAVNIAPTHLRLPDFAPRFLEAIRGWSTEHAGLDVEITEGALNEDSTATVKKLRLLRAVGVRIAIDDFGTGYSSLSRLSSLPIDTLKIDRSFVRPVPQSAQGRVLVQTIISLARGLGLTTVAEGVERLDQLEFMWQSGCNQSQGFLHSRPVAQEQFAAMLANGAGEMLLPASRDQGAETRASRAWSEASSSVTART
jgi:diguanylate cyclase (GGDEF)-like protein